MKKNDVFTFTAPNGAEVAGIVVDIIKDDRDYQWYLCYAQNRIFHYQKIAGLAKPIVSVGVEYAILPDYDELLQLHSSMEFPQWEQNFEAEIQGMNDR